MPLYFPCPCRNAKPSVAQLMRVHVVTPKAPVNIILEPKVCFIHKINLTLIFLFSSTGYCPTDSYRRQELLHIHYWIGGGAKTNAECLLGATLTVRL